MASDGAGSSLGELRVGDEEDSAAAGAVTDMAVANGGVAGESLEYFDVRMRMVYPKPEMKVDEENLQVPYPLLCGESVLYLGRCTGGSVLALSNYRLFLRSSPRMVNVPLTLIEMVEIHEKSSINLYCKNAHAYKLTFNSFHMVSEWYNRLSKAIQVPAKLDDTFPFVFLAYHGDNKPITGGGSLSSHSSTAASSPGINGGGSLSLFNGASAASKATNGATLVDQQDHPCGSLCKTGDSAYSFDREVQRLGFLNKKAWRISYINENFELCSTYPRLHIVPAALEDKDLKAAATFRACRRFPSVVWRHQKNGAVIIRCSQPEVGWLGWRNKEDEQLMSTMLNACLTEARGSPVQNGHSAAAAAAAESSDDDATMSSMSSSASSGVASGPQQNGVMSNGVAGAGADATVPVVPSAHPTSDQNTPEGDVSPAAPTTPTKKLLIIDARSYAAAVANRAKGGGCECIDYYPDCDIQWMSLANIHYIRKSFQAMRLLCSSSTTDHNSWMSGLEGTRWLSHLSALLRASLLVVHVVHAEARPVLVHCSDGWDRTPQISATAQLILDPYYRTIEGFRMLVQREWLEFGHKFADRCGLGGGTEDTNERSPIFLQWLDLVHQLLHQFPCAFQFNQAYLVKLAQHTYSSLFGTFLCNSVKERNTNKLSTYTMEVWSLLEPNNKDFYNALYVEDSPQVLPVSGMIRDLVLWHEVYLSTTGTNTTPLDPPTPDDPDGGASTPVLAPPLAKTRSCEDLRVTANNSGANADSGSDMGPRRLSDPSLAAPAAPSQAPGANSAPSTTPNLDAVTYKAEGEGEVKFQTMNGHDKELPPLESDEEVDVKSESKSKSGEDIALTGTHASPKLSQTHVNGDTNPGPVICQQPSGSSSSSEIANGNGASPSSASSPSPPAASNGQCKVGNGQGEGQEAVSADADEYDCNNGSSSISNDVTQTEEEGNDLTHDSVNNHFLSSSSQQPHHPQHLQLCDMINEELGGSSSSSGAGSSTYLKNNGSSSVRIGGRSSIEGSTETLTGFSTAGGANNSPTPYRRNIDSNLPQGIAVSISTSTTDISDSRVGMGNGYHMNGAASKSNLDSALLSLSMGGAALQQHQQRQQNGMSGACGVGSNLRLGGAGTQSMLRVDVDCKSTAAQSTGSDTSGSPSPGTESKSLSAAQRGWNGRGMDCDGLTAFVDPVQARMAAVEAEYKRKLQQLQKELTLARTALHNNYINGQALDLYQLAGLDSEGGSSMAGGIDTGGESGTSEAGSWEQVDESEAELTKWIPDHVAQNCTDCDEKFWIARRKHHCSAGSCCCRKCGRVFCSDCSQYTLAIPEQMLDHPVRVCRRCYTQSNSGSSLANSMVNNHPPAEECYSSPALHHYH